MPTNHNSESIFRRHIADTLEKDQPKKGSSNELKHQPAGKLLGWILNSWKEPTISIRDIYWRGPRPRILKEVINAAETLARQGWLTPTKTHRQDRKTWRIVREMDTPTDAGPLN
jgi:hypothetical protein